MVVMVVVEVMVRAKKETVLKGGKTLGRRD